MKAFVAAALVITAAPVIANGVPGQDGATEAKQDSEPRICRRVNTSRSQTRIGRGRLCLTAAQWRARGDTSVDDAMTGMDSMLRTQGRPVTKGTGSAN